MWARIALAIAVTGTAALAMADTADDRFAVAAGHYARQRWQLAYEGFDAFVRDHAEHPRSPEAAFYLGESLVQLGQSERARERLADFVREHPDHALADRARFRAAEAAYFLGRHAAAQQELEDFRRRAPDDRLNAYVLPYLGDLALDAGQFEIAARHFRRGLAEFPQGRLQDDCRLGLARALAEAGRWPDAEPLFSAVAAKTASPLADDAQYHLGAALYAAGDYRQALGAFDKFAQRFSGSPLAQRVGLGRAWALFGLGEYVAAGQCCESLLSDAEVGREAAYWRGLALKAENQWTAAVEALSRVSPEPRDELAAAAAYHRADALLRAGQADEAEQGFAELLAATAPHASTWRDDALLGRLQAAQVRTDHAAIDQAAADLLACEPASPHAAAGRRIWARSLTARKQYEAASTAIAANLAEADPTPEDRCLQAAAALGLAQHAAALQAIAPLLGDDSTTVPREAGILQAAALAALDRHAEAVSALERLLPQAEGDPLAAETQARLAISLARLGQTGRARAAYEKFRALTPGAELLRTTRRNLGDAAHAAGDFAWAEELFGGTSDSAAAESAAELSGLGWSQFRAEKFAAAAETIAGLLQRFPDDPLAAEAAVVRGQSLERTDRTDDALAVYRWAIEHHPHSKHLAANLAAAARLAARSGDHQQAAEYYARLAGKGDSPDPDAVLYHWAWSLRALGRDAEADQRFEQLRTLFPRSTYRADATFRLAERAFSQGPQTLQRAEELVAEVLAAQPKAELEQHALFLQGQLAVSRTSWPDVSRPLEALVEKHPDSPLRLRAEYWLAESDYRQGRFDTAAARFADLIPRARAAEEPWTGLAALRRAQALLELRRYSEADRAARQMGEDYPGFAQQHEADYVLGRCHAARGEFEEARAAYRRVVESPSGSDTETAAQAEWMTGESYFQQEDYAQALRAYLRLEMLYAYPKWQAAAVFEAARCLEALGEEQQAVDTYSRLLAEYPQSELCAAAAARLAAVHQRSEGNP